MSASQCLNIFLRESSADAILRFSLKEKQITSEMPPVCQKRKFEQKIEQKM